MWYSLTPPFTMLGSSVAKVEQSKHKDFPEGGTTCVIFQKEVPNHRGLTKELAVWIFSSFHECSAVRRSPLPPPPIN